MMTSRDAARGGDQLLPADPSEDELARHWSLTPADLIEIGRCRGDDHRRRFALQLCTLRTYGRFLDDYRQAPLRIVNHLSRQIGLPPVLFLDRPGRGQTERAQALRIRRYLGLRSFDRAGRSRSPGLAAPGCSRRARHGRAAGAGRRTGCGSWRIMLPAPGTLERIVTSEVARATADLFDTVAAQLPTPCVRPSTCWSRCRRAMPAPACSGSRTIRGAPTAAAIKGDIVRLRLIERAARQRRRPRGDRSQGHPSARRTRPPLRCRRPSPLRQAQTRRARRLLPGRSAQEPARPAGRDERSVPDRNEPPRPERGQGAAQVLRRRARTGLDRVLGAIDALAEAEGDADRHSLPRRRSMPRPWSRRPRHAAPSTGWRSAAISTPCWPATPRCANTCRRSSPCRSRPPSAASR